jgi:hypothetical protein
MIEEEFKVEPDARMSLFIGGFDANGQPLPMSPGRLRSTAGTWALSTATPPGIADLLKTSRALFVQSYFAYEFLTVGVLVSLQAVETSLRVRLEQPRERFHRLIDRGASESLYDDATRERLHAGRELRNLFSHPDEQVVWTYGMTAPLIAGSHDIVAALFPRP